MNVDDKARVQVFEGPSRLDWVGGVMGQSWAIRDVEAHDESRDVTGPRAAAWVAGGSWLVGGRQGCYSRLGCHWRLLYPPPPGAI